MGKLRYRQERVLQVLGLDYWDVIFDPGGGVKLAP
jgi:hypothetical protein